MGCTRRLAEYVSNCEFADLPPDVRDRATTLVRDLLGVALYGSRQPIGERIHSYVDLTAPGEWGTVIGTGTASPTGAALANGVFAHATDYDDTFESIILHPSAPVFPAALAAAEHVDATGRELLAGYVIGVDAAYRIGRAVFPAHYDHGWHATGTIGSFGAAAAAASILDQSAETVEHTVGIVASSSSSLLKNAGSMTKPLHAGHAAQMGLQAALLADEGFTATRGILDGPRGYGAVMTPGGEFDPSSVSGESGEEWAIRDVGIKPYPSGRITHAGMEALRTLMLEEDLTAADVTSVTVTLDDAAEKILTYEEPENQFEAKASIEFPHAAILREREAGVRLFTDEYITAEETREQMAKVERAFEADLFDDGYAGYGARVAVETTGGRKLVAEEETAIGSPVNPLSEDRLQRKFDECASTVLDDDERERLENAIETLDSAESLDGLCSALVPRTVVDSLR